jgi:hypothetical protein
MPGRQIARQRSNHNDAWHHESWLARATQCSTAGARRR